jgi:hypothetical protein
MRGSPNVRASVSALLANSYGNIAQLPRSISFCTEAAKHEANLGYYVRCGGCINTGDIFYLDRSGFPNVFAWGDAGKRDIRVSAGQTRVLTTSAYRWFPGVKFGFFLCPRVYCKNHSYRFGCWLYVGSGAVSWGYFLALCSRCDPKLFVLLVPILSSVKNDE